VNEILGFFSGKQALLKEVKNDDPYFDNCLLSNNVLGANYYIN